MDSFKAGWRKVRYFLKHDEWRVLATVRLVYFISPADVEDSSQMTRVRKLWGRLMETVGHQFGIRRRPEEVPHTRNDWLRRAQFSRMLILPEDSFWNPFMELIIWAYSLQHRPRLKYYIHTLFHLTYQFFFCGRLGSCCGHHFSLSGWCVFWSLIIMVIESVRSWLISVLLSRAYQRHHCLLVKTKYLYRYVQLTAH